MYIGTIILNKNNSKLSNKAIKTDLILVLFTIIIPVLLICFGIELNITIVPLFIILYIFFKFLDNNAHKLYLNKEDTEIQNEITNKEKRQIHNRKKTIRYTIILIITVVLLFVVGELFGNTIENLCNIFDIPQTIVGILMGFITSIPELITFFETQRHHKKLENDILGVVEATNNLLTSNLFNLYIIQSFAILLLKIL